MSCVVCCAKEEAYSSEEAMLALLIMLREANFVLEEICESLCPLHRDLVTRETNAAVRQEA